MSAKSQLSSTGLSATEPPKPRTLSLDVWAVLLAFVLALLVRAGVLQHVGW